MTQPAKQTAGIAPAARQSRQLLLERFAGAHWEGRLSSSALSTATAVTALSLVLRNRTGWTSLDDAQLANLISGGIEWLARHQNDDGGWGDTIKSLSNISTTLLCWSSFGAAEHIEPKRTGAHPETIRRAEEWLRGHAGGIEPPKLQQAVLKRYGRDRTFSVPILMTCVLGGRFGTDKAAWRYVLPLPFELAALPASWFGVLRLPVVSYALPALIAIGQTRHRHLPSRNPVVRWIRNRAAERTLMLLEKIQPTNGGFLEATPLTSFVSMSLASCGLADHPVVRHGVDFLCNAVLPDGSWAIDTNLATWLTTLSVNALSAGEASFHEMHPGESRAIRDWLIGQQYREIHPYTNAPPGGWAWTNLPGGVPDADDTAGALLALRELGEIDERALDAARAGINWLLDLQNSDGGIPTFCSGWGALPFDRSSPDLTAHAIRAWLAWMDDVPALWGERLQDALRRAVRYLGKTQREDGTWAPLWFGKQFASEEENATYGTARVTCALAAVIRSGDRLSGVDNAGTLLLKAAGWLVFSQGEDGSWSGFRGGPASVEETALAVEALASIPARVDFPLPRRTLQHAVQRGARWLAARLDSVAGLEPSPIGFYFAKLWYYEELYPLIFATGALQRAAANRELARDGFVLDHSVDASAEIQNSVRTPGVSNDSAG
jgi:squalene-hopene/tetraprenyl-beta-curcumene cyclase